jgi:hypothetical protein
MSYAEPPGLAQFPAAYSVITWHCGFQRPERRSSRLPFDMNRSQFSTVSDGINQQAVTGLLWLSYSLSGFSPDHRAGLARSRASPRYELPTLARLNEPDGTLTRFARCKSRYGPNPLDGICTHFDNNGPAHAMGFIAQARSVSVAPSTTRSDRT